MLVRSSCPAKVRPRANLSLSSGCAPVQVLDAVCKRYDFRHDLFVRQAASGPGIKNASVQPCNLAPLSHYDLQQFVKVSHYHGFGCLGIKARPSPGQSPAIIELNARLGMSMVWLVPQLLRQFHLFGAHASAQVRAQVVSRRAGPERSRCDAHL